MVSVRLYQPEDYPKLVEWWNGKNFPPPPEMFLPKDGLIISIGDKEVAAQFLYRDSSSPVGWAEWLISNPDSSRDERDIAIPKLLAGITALAGEYGVNMLFTSTNKDGLVKRFEADGYIKSDTNVTHLIKGVICQP